MVLFLLIKYDIFTKISILKPFEGVFSVDYNVISSGFVKDIFTFTSKMSISDIICSLIFIYSTYIGCTLPDKTDAFVEKYFGYKTHRGITHTIYPVIILLLLYFFLLKYISFIACIFFYIAFGYLNHLFYDSFSKMGVCFLYPNYRKYGNNGAKVKRGHIFKLYRVNVKGGNFYLSEYIFVAFVIMITISLFIKK